MKRQVLRRFVFYVILLTAMGYSISQVDVPGASAPALCCTFGNQCPAHTLCCMPAIMQAPCSQNKRNYCQTEC
jgi:hypothetical protein